MKWTPDAIETLKREWAAGKSATIVARIIGARTRNEVIGKINRLGLHRIHKMPTVRSKPGPFKLAPPKPPPPPPMHQRTPSPETFRTVALLGNVIWPAFPARCKFPIGDVDVPGFRFCAEPTGDELKPYCALHQEMCWHKPRSEVSEV